MTTPSPLNSNQSTAQDDVAKKRQQEACQKYRIIRACLSDDVPITLLHIGAEQTLVASGRGSEPETLLFLAIGSRKTAADHFRQPLPTPGEMENAIMAVEDEVSRARTLIAHGSTLFTTDPAIREIAALAGVPNGNIMILAIDQMERAFDRLASVVLGRPASQEGIPDNANFAASLLILREFMHHLLFESITIKA